MTKMRKEQANAQIKTLIGFHDEIKMALEEKEYNIALDLLKRSQEMAIEFGTMIELTEGNAVPTVLLLEDYCELVFRIYEKVKKGLSVRVNEIYEDLRKAIIKIENSVENDIKVRTEIVFFPYKASMWDSLESVWKAADEDPDCDVFVIPIPYYDKAFDGSFGEMHYEGDQYPQYVSITNYDSYDEVNRHPDVIFIHNPYDNNNLATSVAPRFYSSVLRKHTNLLCYIPYFITMGGIGKHLCTVSACVYADKIFLESERVRKIYVDSLAEDCCGHRDFFEPKFEVLGSPKTDKIFTLDVYTREEAGVPAEKKIILLNTSVGGMLKDSERWLDKLQKILQIFACEREIILWWRPHPLMADTIKSMRPRLWERYQKMVREFMVQRIGIYDDSVDMYRAIALSDGYYGDRSSIVQLYGITGKPILLEDVSVDVKPWIPPGNLEDMFQEKIYEINKKRNPRIHEFLLHEKDISLSCFISYMMGQTEKDSYKERVRRQAYCYENSMVCNKGRSGERIARYVKNYLSEER